MEANAFEASALQSELEPAADADASKCTADVVGEHQVVGVGEVLAMAKPVEGPGGLIDEWDRANLPDLVGPISWRGTSAGRGRADAPVDVTPTETEELAKPEAGRTPRPRTPWRPVR